MSGSTDRGKKSNSNYSKTEVRVKDDCIAQCVHYLNQQLILLALLFQEFLTLLSKGQISQQHLRLILGIPVKDEILQNNEYTIQCNSLPWK